ncbi:MAG TPA: sigma 54-interacting transcriptional regulator [Syntrophomonadaceae bacterium]|nr:sigma 54-interacting transcriptional regulator [Syntrophomonadaceae bacterium]
MDAQSYHNATKLEAIIESSFDGILVTDGIGNVLMVNKAYERLTGIKVEEMRGKNMRELLNPEFMPRSAALMVLEEKKPITIPQQTRNGRNIMVTGSPVYNAKGEIDAVITNVRDITEIYQLRQELLKAQEMEKIYYSKFSAEKVKGPIAVSNAMQDIYSLAQKVSPVDVTVLILGESGVGKDVIARYIHEHSQRSNGPLITINCGAIPEQLLESELFGYVGGAFTGANKKGKTGLFEMAKGGTLFLDEIGELGLNLQVKILRAIESGEITRVGAVNPISTDVRILAATNRNLAGMVSRNEFREDLYYRLNVVQIEIPPLREHVEDIGPLSIYFLKGFNRRYNQNKKLIYEVIRELEKYRWPGNIRELKNVIERMVVISSGEYIQLSDLPWYSKPTREDNNRVFVQGVMPVEEAIEQVEKQILANALKEFKTSRKIASAVGLNQSTVVRKMKKYDLGKVDN